MLARETAIALGSTLCALSMVACGTSDLHISGAPPASTFLESFDGKPASASLGEVRLRRDVCQEADTRPPGRPLEADDFVSFLRSRGLETRTVRARHDLVLVDVLNAGTPAPVRFRVAVLDTPGAAGNELHTALLQRGRGTWGLHRSNLAVLAPPGSPDDVVVMAAKLRLACWGVLMIAGHDDTFVVPGGYTEL